MMKRERENRRQGAQRMALGVVQALVLEPIRENGSDHLLAFDERRED